MKKNEASSSEAFQSINFYLTLALSKDDESGDFTAYYVQFPEACAQGRDEKEAVKLLDEVFPFLLQMKKDEFIKYHKANSKSKIEFKDRQMTAA
jgi:predicted RNase H-like HicB family nuclease